MNVEESRIPPARRDLSWLMLLVLLIVVIGALWLQSYTVLYTEGEVVQSLFKFLVILIAACGLLGIYRRRIAAWVILAAGGALLLHQAYQIRKWAMIHEEIIGIVRYAQAENSRSGHYPKTLDGYTFQREWVRDHLADFTVTEQNKLSLHYFMENTGITYWYYSDTGFGYYPD